MTFKASEQITYSLCNISRSCDNMTVKTSYSFVYFNF